MFWLGELTTARVHLEQGIALYNPRQHHTYTVRYGEDPGVVCLMYAALALWEPGYPDQALSTEHRFAHWLAGGALLRGWALVEQGQGEEGITQLCQGIAMSQATGAKLGKPYTLARLAEAYGNIGEVEKGLDVLTDMQEASALLEELT